MTKQTLPFVAPLLAILLFVQAPTQALPVSQELVKVDVTSDIGAGEICSPSTYPYAKEMEARGRIVIDGLKNEDLGKWRKGFFSGGDPGKYLPGAAMAKLFAEPKSEEMRAEVVKYMNDNRSFKEHYHFAAVNWGRFLPLFGEILTPETKAKLSEEAAKYTGYISGTGTENHRTMWYTTALVLPHFIEGERFGGMGKEEALNKMKERLREYVKGLYLVGSGEWDSSTYTMFTINGLLNIYDFSPDAETRLMARAALDMLVASYALKYTDGVFTGPNQRGFAGGAAKTIADQTGWLWWGSSANITTNDTGNFRHTFHAYTSKWKPNIVLSNIATRNFTQFPVEQLNSKANYWWGQQIEPKPGSYYETVYIQPHYTLAGLWQGRGGQCTRMSLTAKTDSGPIVLTGGQPTGRSDGPENPIQRPKYTDGNGLYDQSFQISNTYVCMSMIPEDDPYDYAFFTVPAGFEPEQQGDWWLYNIGKTRIAIASLSGKSELGLTDLSEKQQKQNEEDLKKGKEPRNKQEKILKFPGRKTGFILVATDDKNPLSYIVEKTKLNLADYAANGSITFSMLDGRSVSAMYQTGKNHPSVTVSKKKIELNWPVFSPEDSRHDEAPYVTLDQRVLQVFDGTQGFQVDFTGDLPVYSEWKGILMPRSTGSSIGSSNHTN